MNTHNNLKKFLSLLVSHVGGRENIKSYTNCMTRLRITLREVDSLSMKEIEEIASPHRLILKEDQLQILLGPGLASRSTNLLKEILEKDVVTTH